VDPSLPSDDPERAPRPLWIDTDLGVDDLMAILMVRAAGRPVDGCSLVFGNAPLPRVLANAAAFAATFDWAVPLYAGAERALVAPLSTATDVLGDSGMPSRGRRLDERRLAPVGRDAPDAFAAWLDGVGAPPDVLALGPLTNLARVATAHPERFARIRRLVWMGGAATRGNHTPSAEFNAFADPEALDVVARSGVPFEMLDLDVCRQVTIGPEDLLALERIDTPRGRLLHDLVGGYLDIGLSRGRGSMSLYDPVAAAALLVPTVIEFERVALRVDCSGSPSAGRTVLGGSATDARTTEARGVTTTSAAGDAPTPRRGPFVDIGRAADAAAIRTRLFDALERAAKAPDENTR